MAATDAPKVHYQTLGVGSARSLVIELLGPPFNSYELTNGQRLDRYEFKSGMGDRALRAVGFAVADILTLGITELISTPFEAVKRADNLRAEALFDSDDMLIAMQIRKEGGEPVAVVGDTRPLAKTAAMAEAFDQASDAEAGDSSSLAEVASEGATSGPVSSPPPPTGATSGSADLESERAELVRQYRLCLKRSETDASVDCSGYRGAIEVLD